MGKAIVWFTNNLRLHDNNSLTKAIKNNNEILFLYILNPALKEEKTSIGFNRMGDFRYKFLRESLEDLNTNLQKQGQQLTCRYGQPSDVLCELCIKNDVTTIYVEEPLGNWEIKELGELRKCVPQTVTIISSYDGFCVHPTDYDKRFDDLPDVFTDFKDRVEKNFISVKLPLSVPPLDNVNGIKEESDPFPEPEPLKEEKRTAFPFSGGEDSALKRIQDYIWLTEKIMVYKATRNRMIGPNYSTKFSPWLANGSVSPRRIWGEVTRFEQSKIGNDSTYWVKFELLWRDFFRYINRKYGQKIFQLKGLKDKAPDLKQDMEAFEKWRLGQTEDDFVNANMKELLLTGWMSNRGRQVVASYLVHELKVDWRMGAEWFEHQLIDYDVNSNWCNWMYVAGVGNDPRPNRIFNTKVQAERYDPDGRYQNLWLNEQQLELL